MTARGKSHVEVWEKAQRLPLWMGGTGCVGVLFFEALIKQGDLFFMLWFVVVSLYVLFVPPLLLLLFACEWFLDRHDPGWRNRS